MFEFDYIFHSTLYISKVTELSNRTVGQTNNFFSVNGGKHISMHHLSLKQEREYHQVNRILKCQTDHDVSVGHP